MAGGLILRLQKQEVGEGLGIRQAAGATSAEAGEARAWRMGTGQSLMAPLASKGLSRVFSNTTVQKHQFFKQFMGSLRVRHD